MPFRPRSWTLLTLGAGVAAFAIWFFSRPAVPNNAIAIVPARWTFLDPAGLDAADEALASAITADVARGGRVPLIPWRAIQPYRTDHKLSPELAKETGATRVMAVSVRRTGLEARVTIFLAEPFTGRKLWVEDFYSQSLVSPEAVEKLAGTIARDLEIVLGVAPNAKEPGR